MFCRSYFFYKGLTGENRKNEWNNAKGLVKKIFLKEGIAIIDISKKELQLIKNGKRLYDIIQSKYENLLFMTDIGQYKIEHVSSKKINENK